MLGAKHYHNNNEYTTHTTLAKHETALVTAHFPLKLVIFTLIGFLTALMFLNWQLAALIIVTTLSIFYCADLLFTAFLVSKNFKSTSEIVITDAELEKTKGADWPKYTILCPLYREARVVAQYVAALEKLDYPKDKLQVLLLLEEDDAETLKAIQEIDHAAYITPLVVPHSLPKTKPKALNYGLAHATGQYVVIYDAEDIPEPTQLKKVILAFAKSPTNVVCMQAKLNFYNNHHNILTRLFTIEYSLWFDLVLTGLQSIAAPIPLGGTSNHFRKSRLMELEGWDAFNVTEDCDLGMRLAKRGYQTAIVDSTTHEEATSSLLNWFRQRSRWIKGYYQTYFVHLRQLDQFKTTFPHPNLFIFHLIVGSKMFTLLTNPLLWVITILYFAFRATLGPIIESWYLPPVYYVAVVCLIFGNFLYLYVYMIGAARKGHWELVKYGYLVPVYWLMMSTAALYALIELVINPHYWQKTHHGHHLKKDVLSQQAVKVVNKVAISLSSLSSPA